MKTLSTLRVASTLIALGCAAPTPAAQKPAANAPGPAPAQNAKGVHLGDPPQLEYTAEFFPGTTYDAAITKPDAILGAQLGSRPAHHAEMLACWNAWAKESPRVKRASYGFTHEGRELSYGVVSSPENIRDLDAILERIGKLADPRKLGGASADSLISSTPAIAWLAYSIHGDEMSGVDGGLAVAYHLIAGTSPDVVELLKHVVVVIDPMQNPDGRERFLSMLEQSSGATPTLDAESMQHGRWPYGRGNHYLFDMNRDWLAGVAPETRGRWAAVQRFHPQLFVDAHEMGRDDTFLFYPQARPINPHLPSKLIAWQNRFAADQSAAFDAHGWSYYTREWADAWAPIYSDSWGSLISAVGILYEQARYDGQSVRKQTGEVGTYREATHHQAVSSMSNVKTLVAHHDEVLHDYFATRCTNTYGVDHVPSGNAEAPKGPQYLVVKPAANFARNEWLLGTLVGQGIEVQRIKSAKMTGVLGSNGAAQDKLDVVGDLWLVSALQPQGAMVRAFLELDTRYPKEDLLEERKELETKGNSKIYDTTAWDLIHALGLEAWWCDSAQIDGAEALTTPPPRESGVAAARDPKATVYGWLVDGADDDSVTFAAHALDLGLQVQFADEPFENSDHKFPRGSLLVRAHENGANVAELVAQAAHDAKVLALPSGSGRAPGEGHDLGGQHFHLLARPRVALVSNTPVSSDEFGHLWQELDRNVGTAVSLVDAQALGSYDLRRYNVLILPSAGGMGEVLAPIADDLKAWVRSGGTLIAIGGSARALASEKLGFSGVRLRQDVLTKLDEYRFAAQREQGARKIEIDEDLVWNGAKKKAEGSPAGADTKPSDAKPETPKSDAAAKDDAKSDARSDTKSDAKKDADPDAEREDAWRRRFAPAGVFLRGMVRNDAWISAGCDDEMPVFFEGSGALMSRSPVMTAVRLAPADKLRLAGLLWPEARERLADTAYLTVEGMGAGQVILFAAQPGFRGYHKATARLFDNAVIYGPGVGANAPPRW
jgi:hypothetical protein